MTTLDLSIAAGGDDARYVSIGSIYAPTSGLSRFGNHVTDGNCGSCFRFACAIPQGATIDVAYLSINSEESLSSTGCNVLITAAAEDNAAMPSDYTDATTRARTASAAWAGIASTTEFSYFNSPSIITPLQAVVSRAGFVSGNYILFFIDNNASTALAYRTGYSYEGASGDPNFYPKVHIEYTVASKSLLFNDRAMRFRPLIVR